MESERKFVSTLSQTAGYLTACMLPHREVKHMPAICYLQYTHTISHPKELRTDPCAEGTCSFRVDKDMCALYLLLDLALEISAGGHDIPIFSCKVVVDLMAFGNRT